MEAQISVEFEEATSRQSLNSGETINTLWGKVKRWLSDLKVVCFSGSYNDLSDTPTTATKDTDGLMSAEDKSKLDGVATGANKTIVDTILSNTSTNPVQNKVVKQAIDNKADKSLYGDTTINVGRKTGTDVGDYSTAEGYNTTANGKYSHSEGEVTTASGEGSHAEGIRTKATGRDSHAEGAGSVASGSDSHAGGNSSIASGLVSFSHGIQTSAQSVAEVAFGQYNISSSGTLFSIGDGTADDARHNAFEITTTGGKLHDKDIATTDLIPTTLPANGGNADTLDGLHATDFITGETAQQLTTIDDCITAGAYAVSTVYTTDLPTEFGTWGIMDVRVYGLGIFQVIYFTGTKNIIHRSKITNQIEWTPWKRINEGGNADTVGGKVPEKIFYDNGLSIDLNGATQSGCYATSPDTLNVPFSTWWLVDTMNFNNNQFIVQKAHALGNTADTVSYIRNYANNVWSDWKEISTTPIKKMTFQSVATNSSGEGNLFLSDFGTPIVIACTSRIDTQCTPFLTNNQWLVLAKDCTTLDPIPAGTYSFDVWYI